MGSTIFEDPEEEFLNTMYEDVGDVAVAAAGVRKGVTAWKKQLSTVKSDML